jgi:hypothetical protein
MTTILWSILWLVLPVAVGSLNVRVRMFLKKSELAKYNVRKKRSAAGLWWEHTIFTFVVGLLLTIDLVAFTPVTSEMLLHSWWARALACSIGLFVNGFISFTNARDEANENVHGSQMLSAQPYGGEEGRIAMIAGLLWFLISIVAVFQ